MSNVIAGDENPDGYYILGAHFDTVAGTPGADDNASGVAVLLEVARLARGLTLPRPWAFIGFTCEEPPVFSTSGMGSRVYAKQARRAKSQDPGDALPGDGGILPPEPWQPALPLPLKLMGYPTTGNFIGLVSDRGSRPLLERLAGHQGQQRLPTATLAAPLGGHLLPEVRQSDHANFWDEGYPAIMLTDTAFMRNPNYHGPGDVMEILDLTAMMELTLGLVNFVGREGR